jgi:hypothetical protein
LSELHEGNPMSRSPRRLALSLLALVAALASSHCQRDANAPNAAADCCVLTPNAALPASMGRVVVNYPGEGADATRLDVYAAGTDKAVGGHYGDAGLELAPGTYDATVGGRRVTNVGVRAGHDTRIRIGVLHVQASDATRIDLVEPTSGEKFAGHYGETQIGLPIGRVAVEVAGQQETALIEDGKVTEVKSLGRVVVAYPEEVAARIDVYRGGEQKAIASGYGDQGFDLFPGTYDVSISGKRIAGVAVQSAQATPIAVGVLRMNVSDGTRIDLVDPASKERIASGYGPQLFGLPAGEIGVEIAGQTETVAIEAGQVTDF